MTTKSIVGGIVVSVAVLMVVLLVVKDAWKETPTVRQDNHEQFSREKRASQRDGLTGQTVDQGHWSAWQEQRCTFTSIGCRAFKLRQCFPKGAMCVGISFENVNCSSKNCPAFWTEWAVDKDSKDRCIHTRQRDCTGLLQNGDCTELETQAHLCNTSHWSNWGEWACHHAKDEYCHNQRDRECYIGSDQIACLGLTSETAPCSTTICKDYFNPQWKIWSAWSCNDGLVCFHKRNRTCSTGRQGDCVGEHEEVEACTTCAFHWLEWGHWACVQTHDVTSHTRVRNCSTGDANQCNGKSYQHEICNQASCPECYTQSSLSTTTTTTTTTGSWLEWSTPTCAPINGVMFSHRIRKCSTGNKEDCNGEAFVSKECVDGACPVCQTTETTATMASTMATTPEPAHWLEWSHSICTPTHGGFTTANRVRNCSTNQQTDCGPDYYTIKPCITDEMCPECFNISAAITTTPTTTEPTPLWSNWTSWKCSHAHNLVFRIRYRDCLAGACADDDKHELIYCNQTSCPDCFLPSGQAIDPCRDEADDQCDSSDFSDIVCNDTHLAIRYCRKTCKLCVPQRDCVDAPGCDKDLRDVVCLDDVSKMTCPILCNLCVPVTSSPISSSTSPTTKPSITQTTVLPISPSTFSTANCFINATTIPTTTPTTLSTVGTWSSWVIGQCSVTCGQGRSVRLRSCSTGHVEDCVGNAMETVPCQVQTCSVGSWSPWIVGQCPVTCGQGTTMRFRQCSTGHQEDCAGNAFESVMCNTNPCPAVSTTTQHMVPASQCASAPCHHGGTCEDLPGTFNCFCTGGYYGPTCDDDYDECKYRRPCTNGATCINTVGSYTCTCSIGFTGQDCDQTIKACEDNPSVSCQQQRLSRCNDPNFARECPKFCRTCQDNGVSFIG